MFKFSPITLLIVCAFTVGLAQANTVSYEDAVKGLCYRKLVSLKKPSEENRKKFLERRAFLQANFKGKSNADLKKMKAQVNSCKQLEDFEKGNQTTKAVPAKSSSKKGPWDLAVDELCQSKIDYLASKTPANKEQLKKNQTEIRSRFPKKSTRNLINAKKSSEVCVELERIESGKSINKISSSRNSYELAVDELCTSKIEYLVAKTPENKKRLDLNRKELNKKFPKKSTRDLINTKKNSESCGELSRIESGEQSMETTRKRYVSQNTLSNKAATQQTVKVVEKPKKLDMYLNVGIGPQVSRYSSPIEGNNLAGIGFDFFYVIPAKSVKKHRKNLPDVLKSSQSADQDFEYYPFGVLALMPTKITLSPAMGGTTSSYGLTFGALGYYKTFLPQETLSLKTGVKLPVVNYEYLDSDHIKGGPVHFLAVGAAAELKGIYKVNSMWNISLEWHGQVHLPLKDTEVVNNRTNETENLWYKNTLGLMFHYKLPWIKNL